MTQHGDNSVPNKGVPPSGSPRSWRDVVEPLDAGNLLDLARQRSQESRESLASFMIELLDGQSGVLSDSERSLTSDILRTIIFKVERSIRDRLVSVIADIEGCPYDLIWFLANEPIEIAYPILLRSTVLRDADLIELVQRKAIEHRMTIAARPNLSPAVSDTIARVAESEVIVRLLRNETAALGESTLACLVERARTDQVLHEPLVKRPEMTAELAQKLVHWVSDALREYILSHWTIPAATLDESLETVLEDAAILTDTDEIEAPVDPTIQTVPGDPDRLKRLIISAMGVGDLRLVVSLISASLGVRKALIRRVLAERSSESLAVVCRALGMTSHEFLSFSAAARLKAHTSGGVDEDPATLAAVYDRISAETARSVVAHWSAPR
ncbi:DUF2336 domain-containing protein [uncultured Rhodospira sp.]|uniref:DUF2336 domain-containing protein n=1 Tax=uncultured Rhodospira sp. TaxID=1936189 RepID=UPI002605022D|nr:DUF2336 domain-containing protein [uncultured Rhodospira sp.]